MDKHFVCTRPWSGEVFPGRIIEVTNVSDTSPVPDWVINCAKPYKGPINDPWPCDAAAAAAEERNVITFAPPPADFRRDDLKRILGVNDVGLNELVAHYGLPRQRIVYTERHEQNHLVGRVTGSFEVWPGPETQKWIEGAERLFILRKPR